MVEAGVDISSSRTTALHQPRQDHSPSPRVPQVTLDAGPCDLVTVPARQGLEAVDILRLRDGVGPVLHDGECDTLGFLVPPGTADAWDVPGSACTQTFGQGEQPGLEEPPIMGTGWLVAPEAAFSEATDPAVLRAALGEAARTIEAVDRCR
ncbi:hypothetical protein [Streptomyces albireticuli]|uniref:Uncharacterized protein n=1 Tax=Streptomyces albireticuli TaxID=1940 RepID=A0A2A2DDD6_9ACTN|nr:hypothetical protein [Streptomyces albireticuli]MCD9141605.1 hypothetical protein [Streptomyces albireticuli]MCD9164144.1 hypothetical protein [Streptomyces albireticuli]MCD9189779.1 hypothetical protein [Streptomyces albireticuli]PAU49544.1 hypothetical protein CK936_07250 [Streptomyces albireticuli]